MNEGNLENIILGVVERYMAGRYHERHGMVTSYDPKKYLAKVMLQPEGQETGWLPIEASHVGEDYGIAVGLQPGDGKSTGDQVVVRFQQGDFEGGKIIGRVHNDEDTPPTVQSGEIVVWTRFKKSGAKDEAPQGGQGGTGQQIYLKNDGSIAWTDGNGASITMDGNGNIIIKCKKWQMDASGAVTMITSGDLGIQGNNVEVNAEGIAGISGAGAVLVQHPGGVSDGAISLPSGQVNILPPTKFLP